MQGVSGWVVWFALVWFVVDLVCYLVGWLVGWLLFYGVFVCFNVDV